VKYGIAVIKGKNVSGKIGIKNRKIAGIEVQPQRPNITGTHRYTRAGEFTYSSQRNTLRGKFG